MKDAASIKDLLAQAENKKRPQPVRCYTCQWLLTLDPEDAQAVQEAIYSGEWDAPTLLATLKPLGLDVDPGGLNHHARQKHQIPAR